MSSSICAHPVTQYNVLYMYKLHILPTVPMVPISDPPNFCMN